MKTEILKIEKIKVNPNNPRFIKDDKFKKLVQSVTEFPDMLNIRPIVINKENIIIGGNMRYRAAIELGYTEVPVQKVTHLTEEQEKEFTIKDNLSYGDWDWNELANNWEHDKLEQWGLDLPEFADTDNEEENPYTDKVNIPIYEPSKDKPSIGEIFDITKYNELIAEIEKSNINKDEKNLLKLAATRHIVFNYRKLADLYAHSNKEMQKLMENSALVIIDYDKALENGFIKLTKDIIDLHDTDDIDEYE